MAKTYRRCLFTLMMISLLLPQALTAQSVVVQLLNGKTRKAMKGYKVYVLLGDPRNQHTLDLMTDKEGKIRFDSTAERTFQVRPVGTADCSSAPPASNTNFSVAEVIEHGVVTMNHCGTFNPEPLRGQVTILTRTASALDLFRN